MTLTSGNDSQRFRAILALVLTATLWSLGGLLIKSVKWDNPIAIAGARSVIAALVIFVYKPFPKFNWSFAQIGGALAYTATVMLFVTATRMTTAANAILLQYTAPIYVALLSWWFLKERITRIDWITLAIVFGGMILFFQDKLSAGSVWGSLVAILSGVAFAGLALFTRKQKNESPLESLLLGNVFTAVIAIPFMIGQVPDTQSVVSLVLLGTVQLGLSYILYAYAMKHVTALEGILIPVIEPVLNPIWVFLAMGEIPGKWAIVGGIMILTAVTGRCVIVALKDRKNNTKEDAHG